MFSQDTNFVPSINSTQFWYMPSAIPKIIGNINNINENYIKSQSKFNIYENV